MDLFDEIATQIHREKEKQDAYENSMRKLKGEFIYTDYKLWCLAFNKGNGWNDEKIFAKYLKEEKIKLTELQRKHLLETYFGYICEIDANGKNKYIRNKKL